MGVLNTINIQVFLILKRVTISRTLIMSKKKFYPVKAVTLNIKHTAGISYLPDFRW